MAPINKVIEWHDNLGPIKKRTVFIVGTIILGSIGSGVWEIILEPFLGVSVHFIISLIGKFSSSYIDDLYGAAARGLYQRSSSLLLFSHGMIFYFGFLIISLIRRKKRIKKELDLLPVQMLLLCISIVIMYHYTKIEIIKNISTSTLNSIEIVHPYINDNDYYKLKSEFYQMQSLADYESIYKKLTVISSKIEGIKIGPNQSF